MQGKDRTRSRLQTNLQRNYPTIWAHRYSGEFRWNMEAGELGKIPVSKWNRTIEINLTGTFNMCNAVMPYMKQKRYGRIINVSSTAGQRGEAFHSQYAASKGGVIAFTKSIAPELIGNGIWSTVSHRDG